MDLSPESLKKQAEEKKSEAFSKELLPLLEKHNASIVCAAVPVEVKNENGKPEIVLRLLAQVQFNEPEKEEVGEGEDVDAVELDSPIHEPELEEQPAEAPKKKK